MKERKRRKINNNNNIKSAKHFLLFSTLLAKTSGIQHCVYVFFVHEAGLVDSVKSFLLSVWLMTENMLGFPWRTALHLSATPLVFHSASSLCLLRKALAVVHSSWRSTILILWMRLSLLATFSMSLKVKVARSREREVAVWAASCLLRNWTISQHARLPGSSASAMFAFYGRSCFCLSLVVKYN